MFPIDLLMEDVFATISLWSSLACSGVPFSIPRTVTMYFISSLLG